MSAIDDEILLEAEDDAAELQFIRQQLPVDLKEKFSDDELYYIIDVITEFYTQSDILDAQPDADGYVELDTERVARYVIDKAKKEKIGDFDFEDILLVVLADLDYADTVGEEEEQEQ